MIEAKREEGGHKITAVEEQSGAYAAATLKWVNNSEPLPFVYESTAPAAVDQASDLLAADAAVHQPASSRQARVRSVAVRLPPVPAMAASNCLLKQRPIAAGGGRRGAGAPMAG